MVRTQNDNPDNVLLVNLYRTYSSQFRPDLTVVGYGAHLILTVTQVNGTLWSKEYDPITASTLDGLVRAANEKIKMVKATRISISNEIGFAALDMGGKPPQISYGGPLELVEFFETSEKMYRALRKK